MDHDFRPVKRCRLTEPEPNHQSRTEHPSVRLTDRREPGRQDSWRQQDLQVVGDYQALPIVCYGMVCLVVPENMPVVCFKHCQRETNMTNKIERIPIAISRTPPILEDSRLTGAYLDENGRVWKSSDCAYVGRLSEKARKCLFSISARDHVGIQFMIQSCSSPSARSTATKTQPTASAIIYGPREIADDVGDTLDTLGLCLQEPYACDQNVPYLNPHCLDTAFGGGPLKTTFDIARARDSLKPGETFHVEKFFAGFEAEYGSEQPTPSGLQTELLP